MRSRLCWRSPREASAKSPRSNVLVLFDNNVPRGLARALPGHSVTEARERGWATLKNGALINAAEAAGFQIFVTADKNIRYQQNLTARVIAIVILRDCHLIGAAVDANSKEVAGDRPSC